MQYALECDGIGKQFRIGGVQRGYKTLSETITHWLPRLFDRRSTQETFWALQNVSFKVEPGQIVGIIGRNGAGKSTLLKILCGVTKPTMGSAVVRGRIGSLLEVGTGFHGELTGRENVFLSGAVLGMKRAEVIAKFDEIVAFSGLEKFIDTPVKRYSSGMFLRLGFAVAAHLETEVMLVDEVLAVGDSSFQQRCMEKMRDVTRSGRTILFVSHNLVAISNMCTQCVLLSGGTMAMYGTTEAVLHRYVQESKNAASASLLTRTDRAGNGLLKFESFQLEDVNGVALECAISGKPVVLHFTLRKHSNEPIRDVGMEITLSHQGQRVSTLWTDYSGSRFSCNDERIDVYCKIARLQLVGGDYLMRLGLSSGNIPLDWIEEAASIEVTQGDFYGSGMMIRREKQGLFFIEHDWEARDTSAETIRVSNSEGAR